MAVPSIVPCPTSATRWPSSPALRATPSPVATGEGARYVRIRALPSYLPLFLVLGSWFFARFFVPGALWAFRFFGLSPLFFVPGALWASLFFVRFLVLGSWISSREVSQ